MKAPHFIIIGAMKSATSTLHEQLASQPGIFMSTPKEPNYFSDDEQHKRGAKWYSELFSQALDNDLCGESSTHYTKLPDYPNTIKRLRSWKDEYKFIYVMRHPVDRLVSHYIHQWSEGKISVDINQAVRKFPELVNYSCYAKQLKPYLQVFGQNSILPLFFNQVKSQPQTELNRVATFINYHGVMTWNMESDPVNVSSLRVRKFPGYNFLVQSEISTRIRRAMVPKFIRDMIKEHLRLKTRPDMNPETIEYLESIFDNDLIQFSDWFGTTVNCQNFSDPGVQQTISNHLNAMYKN